MTSAKTSQAAQVIIAVILFVVALSIASSVFAPVAFEGKVTALLEVAALQPFNEVQRELLARFVDVLGLAAAFLGVALGHRLVAPASPEREVQDT